MSSQAEPKQPQIKKRAVVSSFIFQFPDTGESKAKARVALFKRSDKVNTYQHHLAPISGSIDSSDANPLAAAWREVAEETTLTPASLSLWRKGKPYTFSDASIGREWTVHPFAFVLKKTSKRDDAHDLIKTDWEHESWDWYDPASVTDSPEFGGVPRLYESLRRVWFEGDMGADGAGKVLAAGLDRLQQDHESGSRELTAIALGVFRDVIVQLQEASERKPTGLSKRWEMLRLAAWHIWKNGRESIGAATLNALLAALTDMERIIKDKQDSEEDASVWDQLLAVIDRQLERRRSMTARIADAFAAYLRDLYQLHDPERKQDKVTVLTLSASSTIRESIIEAFSSLNILTLDLRVLESRPLYEGVSLASSIYSRFKSQFGSDADRKLSLTIYTDACAALASAGVDVLLMGADRISPIKGVCNKVGSLPAVLSDKHISPRTKVLVLSEVEKVAEPEAVTHGAEEEDPTVEENDAAEVVDGWRQTRVKGLQTLEAAMADVSTRGGDERVTIHVKNVYFEWVPPALVDAFICEEGILDTARIRDKSQAIAAEVEQFFGDL